MRFVHVFQESPDESDSRGAQQKKKLNRVALMTELPRLEFISIVYIIYQGDSTSLRRLENALGASK